MVEYGSFWKTLKEKIRWIDPFTYSDLLLEKINPDNHWYIKLPVELITALISAFILYFVTGLVLQTGMPLVIVVSGSMEPVLHRGDVVLIGSVSPNDLKVPEVSVPFEVKNKPFAQFGSARYFINGRNQPELYSVLITDLNQEIRFDKTGDIVVYFSQFTNEPIIHRAVLKLKAPDGDFILTKGDSIYNLSFDQDCGRIVLGTPERFCITPYAIPASQLQGRALGWLPLVGYVKLILVDDLTELLLGCPRGCRFP